MRALQGVALAALLAGCDINLSDVTLSNIGNGNTVDANVKVGDVNVGGGNQNGGTAGQGNLKAVSLNRPLYRVRLGLDPRNTPDMSAHSQQGSDQGPMPDFALLEEAAVTAQAAYDGGGPIPVPMDSPDWKWILPSSLERVPSPNGQMAFFLVAKPGSATGSHVLRLEFSKDAKIAATASVEILDGGSADVVLE
jgi:hypothetical protein